MKFFDWNAEDKKLLLLTFYVKPYLAAKLIGFIGSLDSTWFRESSEGSSLNRFDGLSLGGDGLLRSCSMVPMVSLNTHGEISLHMANDLVNIREILFIIKIEIQNFWFF